MLFDTVRQRIMAVICAVVTGLMIVVALPATASAAPGPTPDCRAVKCVALTFDDGPTRYTARVLDALEAEHAVATFFVIGPHALAHRSDMLREYRDGDAIGNHTVHHPHLPRLSSARISDELNTAARQIASVTGHRPTILRPPFGAWTPRVRALAGRAHLAVIMWSVDPRDWKNHDPRRIEQRVLNRVRPGDIIDLHDRYPATATAVPRILAALKARHYTLATIPQLFAHVGGTAAGHVYHRGPVG